MIKKTLFWLSSIVSILSFAFHGFAADVKDRINEWKAYFDGPTPQAEQLPGKWEKALNPLQKLGILRCFRPDKVVLGIQNYISATMGQRYIEPPPFDLPLSFISSTLSITSPILSFTSLTASTAFSNLSLKFLKC